MSAPSATGRAARGRGWYWPWLIGGSIAALIVFDAAVVVVAISDPSVAIEPDYYAKGLAWDRAAAAERASAALGWAVAPTLRHAGGAPATVELRVVDRAGQPVAGAAVEADVFHNARSGDRRRLAFAETAPGVYRAALPTARPGLWELRLAARRGTEAFAKTLTVEALP